MESLPILRKLTIPLFFLVLVVQTGCNMPEAGLPAAPTQRITQAYQTVEARLTQAATSTTAAPPTASSTINPTSASSPAATATQSSTPDPTATVVCNRAGAGNPIDLTIPDNTRMQPGEAFTKEWALENVGSCTWTKDYALRFFYGEQMGAPGYIPLRENVAPGQTVNLSIDMVAPENPGTYQGNWKLQSSNDILFGIGPNGAAPFWVRVIVVQPPTSIPPPPAPAPTSTQTPEPTITDTSVPTAAPTLTETATPATFTDTPEPTSTAAGEQTSAAPVTPTVEESDSAP
jgi:hypothetical protein